MDFFPKKNQGRVPEVLGSPVEEPKGKGGGALSGHLLCGGRPSSGGPPQGSGEEQEAWGGGVVSMPHTREERSEHADPPLPGPETYAPSTAALFGSGLPGIRITPESL